MSCLFSLFLFVCMCVCLDNNQEGFDQGEEFADQGQEPGPFADQGKPFTKIILPTPIILMHYSSILVITYVYHYMMQYTITLGIE